MNLRAWAQKVYASYDRFMEKQGFPIVLVTCVLVIVLSALYTFHFREQWETASPVEESISAGGSQNAQTLKEAQALVSSHTPKPVAVPQEPFRFSQPVNGFIDRDFSILEPQLFEAAHYWRVHPGIDLQAEAGSPVSACADGTVSGVYEDPELGLCIRIDHAYGYHTVYAGLSDAGYVRKGDPVEQGQTIGHVGNGVLAESDALPHLHFEVRKGETPIDPVELFLGLENP